uniref:Phytanoyl-CoA hydroxylase-interacting protein-like C-terminal domain-containing protein n=1 Tax=Panagrolaimus davidi TaxID=227884 RepID=A0A914PT01_9BILA
MAFPILEKEDIIPLPLKYEEHIKGCTIFWKKPPPFGKFLLLVAFNNFKKKLDKLEWKKFQQQIIVHSIPSEAIIRHTLINPPIDFVTFETIEGHAYNIQVSLIFEISNGREIIARGFIKFISAKKLFLNKNKFKNVQIIPISVSISSIHCIIQWPKEILERFKGILKIRFWSNGIGSEVPVRHEMSKFEIRSIPGRKYFFELRIFNSRDFRIIAAGDIWFRAVHSQQELAKLYSMAEDYCKTTQTSRFSYFYRTKPKTYFNFCMENDGGIMKVYTKDESGHSASPINSKLDGLFFYAKLNFNGTFPEMSPFGDTRWFIRAENLFNPEKHRLYFADFYCNARTHYVTIVISEMGSKTDEFCKKFLIELDSKNNSFLEYRFNNNNGNIYYFTNMKLWVEFYFTENLPLILGNFKDVFPGFQGSSTIGGVPNNKTCEICNLYPDLF